MPKSHSDLNSLVRKVSKTIDTHSLLKNEECVLIAVSGGSDSMCLLDVFMKLSVIKGYLLEVVHVNHSLRGSDSDSDHEFVKDFCHKNSLLLHDKTFDVREFAKDNDFGIEEAARIIRYKYFDEIIGSRNMKVAVAHHQQDQVETILLNLIRGSGMEGLCGMDYINASVIRPMLDCSKEEILLHIMLNNISFCHDNTNDELCADRNKVRLDLVPYIDRLFSRNISRSVIKTGNLCRQDLNYLEKISSQISNDLIQFDENMDPYLECSKAIGIDIALLSRIIRDLYAKKKGDFRNISYIQTINIIELLKTNKEFSRTDLADGFCAIITNGKLYIKDKLYVKELIKDNEKLKCERNNFEIPFKIGENIYFDEIKLNIMSKLVENPDKVVYNAMARCFPIEDIKDAVWRYRMPGDFIIPNKGSGRKTIKKFLIEKKIPEKQKEQLLFLAKDSQILWIPSLSISGLYEAAHYDRKNMKFVLVQVEIVHS